MELIGIGRRSKIYPSQAAASAAQPTKGAESGRGITDSVELNQGTKGAGLMDPKAMKALCGDNCPHSASSPDSAFSLRLRQGSLSPASGEFAKSRPLARQVLNPPTVLGVKG